MALWKRLNQNQGFTLIEIVLVIAILTIISGFSIVAFGAYQNKHELEVTAYTTTHYLREAYLKAKASQNDDSWSVNILNGNLTLYKGTDYNSRDTRFDQVYQLPGLLVNSGISQVTFSKETGIPSESGSIVLTIYQDTAIVTINQFGFIDY